MIKPTIGRVVWYWSAAAAWQHPDAQPNPALVTFIHSDDCVNLAVFDQSGDHKPVTTVVLWQGDGERPLGEHCEWMPYQKTVAAKQESESKADFTQYFARLDAVEKELLSIRQVAEYIKQLPKQGGQDSTKPVTITGSTMPPAPPKPVGEDPRKDGTGVA